MEEEVTMEENKVVQQLELDLRSARGNHNSQMGIIQEWRSEAAGDNYSEDTNAGDYGLVTPLIKKTIESATPSLVEPFLGSSICKASGRDSHSEQKSKVASAALNYHWNYSISPEDLLD